MSDELDTDPEQQRVRRLLADVAAADTASPPPVPADVAARLDAALADLTRTPTSREVPARDVVVPMRRRLAPLLAAAAAVVVVAGGGALALTGSGGDQAGDAGGSAADSAASSSEQAQTDQPPAASSSQASPGSEGLDSSSLSDDDAPGTGGTPGGEASTRTTPAPYVTRDALAADVTALLADGSVAAAGVGDTTPARERVEGSGCVVPAPERGAATFVVLEGDPAVLVVGAVQDGARPVEVLDCADGSVVAQARVDAG